MPEVFAESAQKDSRIQESLVLRGRSGDFTMLIFERMNEEMEDVDSEIQKPDGTFAAVLSGS